MPFPEVYVEVDWGSRPIGGTYRDSVLRLGPSSYFRFQETSGTTALDMSGSGRTATLYGPVFGQVGPITGEPSDVALGLSQVTPAGGVWFPSAPSTREELTLEAWVFVTSTTNRDIFGTVGVSALDGRFIAVGVSNGQVYINMNGQETSTATGLVTNSAWFHVVTTINGGTRKREIWINGVKRASGSFAVGTVSRTTNQWAWGARSGVVGPNRIDEAATYDYVLTDDDIVDHYNRRTATPPATPVWTDLTERVNGPIVITRGKKDTLSKLEPSRVSIPLRNTDRALEPEYAASPYFPNVEPRKRMRVLAGFRNYTPNPGFRGNTSGWATWSSGGAAPTLTRVARPSSNVRLGDWEGRMTGGAAGIWILLDNGSAQRHAVTPGDRLYLSSTTRLQTGPCTAFKVMLRMYNSAGTYLGSNLVAQQSNPSGTPEMGEVITVPGGVAFVSVELQAEGCTATTDIRPNAMQLSRPGPDDTYVPYINGATENRQGIVPRITAYIEDYDQEPDGPMSGTAQITAVDALGLLNESKTGKRSFLEQSVEDRIVRYMRLAAWPDGRFDLDNPTWVWVPRVGASDELDEPVAEQLVLLAHMSFGLFYIRPDEVAVYQGPGWRGTRARATTSRGTWSDFATATNLWYTDLKWDSGARSILNDVRIARPGGEEIVATSPESQLRFGTQDFSETVPFADDSDSAARAIYIRENFAFPRIRFREMTIEATAQGMQNAWHHLLLADFSDRYTINRTPQGVGTAITKQVYLEGIEETIHLDRLWQSKWMVSLV
jgi:hypothetical protein